MIVTGVRLLAGRGEIVRQAPPLHAALIADLLYILHRLPYATMNATEAAEKKLEPWDRLFAAQAEFLNALDCIHEMFRLVSPLLEQKDAERRTRIEELGIAIEQDGKRVREISDLNEIKIFVRHIRRMNIADRMFRHNVIVSIISKFDEFVITLLRCAFEENKPWLKSPDKTVSYKQLFEIESLDAFVADLIRKEVDYLMRGSHHGQIQFLDSKLKLGIEERFQRWSDFLEITERRNLFVHSGGTVNALYTENAAKFGYVVPEKKRLDAPDDYVATSIDTVYELSIWLLHGVARRLYNGCHKPADRALNICTFNLLTEERWELAERILVYALGIPEKLRDDGEVHFFHRINLCIARKFSGKEYSSLLADMNWDPLHPKYHFARAILDDRFSDAACLMSSEAVRNSIDKNELTEWPLLREFRKSAQFQQTFREMFGHEFQADLLSRAKEEMKEQQDAGEEEKQP